MQRTKAAFGLIITLLLTTAIAQAQRVDMTYTPTTPLERVAWLGHYLAQWDYANEGHAPPPVRRRCLPRWRTTHPNGATDLRPRAGPRRDPLCHPCATL
jgi:hypothetical protein